ncbi:hypothetical protein OTU49_011675 [Cherax quadricarinatus]|uniref:NACHT domain-containing protein n=1 Tax=Cherax quadricarinatus TaxID=27406 RepID=A0AAW0W2V7_CHEQU|nr:uncharacterized protein LOC128697174 isoform X2 [Cherax quadricarinatus]
MHNDLTMNTTDEVTDGIHSEELHKLRYQCAVNKEGQKLLCTIFNWSYLGGNLPIKEYLFTNINFTNVKYKRIFNHDQREKLNAGIHVSSFDITLLYKLLHHVCDLKQNDEDWNSEGPNGPTLENLIFKLKEHRNVLAHENPQMTEKQMYLKLDELRQLYEKIICEAGSRFCKTPIEIACIINAINCNIDSICKKIREPLGPHDISQYQQEIREIKEQLKCNIEQITKEEVKKLYADTCYIDPAPWLLMHCQIKPTQIFTKFTMKEDDAYGLTEEDQQREISFDGILEVKCNDGHSPEVLILTGEGGIGKTTYLKYLKEKWLMDQEAVPGLDAVELLLYVECRHPTISTFDQMLEHILHDISGKVNVEFKLIRDIVLHMQLLILVDGFDEVNKASGCLIRELLNLPRHNIRIIFTTRPYSANSLTKQIPNSKRRINLIMSGITPVHHQQFVERLCHSLDEKKSYLIRDQLKKKLLVLKYQLGMHLNNPLTLTLVALLFLKDPTKIDMLSTATDLYEELRKLITEKLTERLSKYSFELELEEKCYQFLEYSDALSFRAMKRQEYELWSDTVESLKQKCRDIGLNHNEVLSAYFTTRCSRQGLQTILYYTYHHLKLQEFSVAKHILKEITQCSNLEDTVNELLLECEVFKKENRFQNVLVHLTSLLAKNHPIILARYAATIISLVPLNVTYIDSVLAHITESKYNECILRAVAAKLDMHISNGKSQWQITDYGNIPSLSLVLKHTCVVPDMIILSISSYVLHPLLTQALSHLSEQNTSLVLDFPQHYFGSDNSLVDDVLSVLLNCRGPCRMMGFRGPLSPVAVKMLPECVEELRLLIDPAGLNALNKQLPSLCQLNTLGVRYKDEDRTDVNKLPVLKFSGPNLYFTFNPTITDNDEDLDWASGVFAKLCAGRDNGTCTSILFRKTYLTAHGGKKLLKALHKKTVRVTTRLDIYTLHAITRESNKELEELAVTLNLSPLFLHSRNTGVVN